MNTIFYGNKATGKTILAEALKRYYESLGQKTTIYNDEPTPIFSKMKSELLFMERQLKKTLGNPNCHSIITTQAPCDKIYRFYETEDEFGIKIRPIYDYYIHCTITS